MCCVTQSSASSLVFTYCFCSHFFLSTLCPNSHTVLLHPTLSRSHSFHVFFTVFSRHLKCGIYSSVMSSQFFEEPVSRKTSAVRRRSRSTTRSVSCSSAVLRMPQLFSNGFDGAPWHGHKIIPSDGSQDDVAACQGHLFRCLASTQLLRHRPKILSVSLIQGSTGREIVTKLQHCQSCVGSDTSRVCRHIVVEN